MEICKLSRIQGLPGVGVFTGGVLPRPRFLTPAQAGSKLRPRFLTPELAGSKPRPRYFDPVTSGVKNPENRHRGVKTPAKNSTPTPAG